MSIQHNPIYEAAEMPPSPSDAQYWRERHRLEARHFQRRRRRPNPELYQGVRQYWLNLWNEQDDNDSQSA